MFSEFSWHTKYYIPQNVGLLRCVKSPTKVLHQPSQNQFNLVKWIKRKTKRRFRRTEGRISNKKTPP